MFKSVPPQRFLSNPKPGSGTDVLPRLYPKNEAPGRPRSGAAYAPFAAIFDRAWLIIGGETPKDVRGASVTEDASDQQRRSERGKRPTVHFVMAKYICYVTTTSGPKIQEYERADDAEAISAAASLFLQPAHYEIEIRKGNFLVARFARQERAGMDKALWRRLA